MAQGGVIVVALVSVLGATAASAQTYDQMENRYQLRQSQQQLNDTQYRQQLQADQQNRALTDRVNRQAIERQINTPPLRHLPPAGSLQRY
jgi:hypothetical protein